MQTHEARIKAILASLNKGIDPDDPTYITPEEVAAFVALDDKVRASQCAPTS